MTLGVTAVEGLFLRLGAFSLCNITMTVEPGQILAILGPNGAGKSVTLETIAGFHRLHVGRITIGGRDVTDLPPERRRIGLLFQNFGLFPHLTVAANVALGLRAARRWAEPPQPRKIRRIIGMAIGGSPSRDPAVASLLARFRIDHIAGRLPDDLSPGEKQRTALARAMAMQPDLFLFDEPFSALDGPSRAVLREELRAFLRETRVPAIFVTHDPPDAEILADQLAVMTNGTIIQSGSAEDLSRAPANAFVANFVGIQNCLPGRIVGKSGEHWQIAMGEQVLQARDHHFAGAINSSILLCVRGEDIALRSAVGRNEDAAGNPPKPNCLTMRVVWVTGLGTLRKVTLDGGFPLTAYLTGREARELNLVPGDTMIAEIDPDVIHLLADPEGNPSDRS